jgi:ABC-type transport system involved in multi-copper enzyme maturation permease subunit
MSSHTLVSLQWGFPTFRAFVRRLANPIISRELRRLLRTRKAFVGAFVYGLVLLGAVVYFWPGALAPQAFAGAGSAIFLAIATVQLLLFAVIAVITCSGAIAGERENQTDELLHASPLSGWRVIWGKLIASVGYQFLLLIGSIPALSLCFLLGGVSQAAFIRALILAVLVQVQVGSFSLLISAWCRRVTKATVTALVLLVPFGAILSRCVFAPMLVGFHTGEAFSSAEILRVVLSLLLSLGMLRVAASLYRVQGRKPVRTAPPIIDSPELLEQRRRDFPFYLIDPQKRPPPMPEGKNPVLEKEKRTLPIGKPDVLIRSAYIAIAVSILFLFTSTANAKHASVLLTVLLVVVAIIVPGTACGAIAGERQRGTWDLLALSGLSAWRIVNAKFRLCFRYGFVVIISLGLPAFGLHFLFQGLTNVRGLDNWPAIIVGFEVLVVHLLLCVLVGLYFSAIFKRTSFAVLGCYLFLGAAGLAVSTMSHRLMDLAHGIAAMGVIQKLAEGDGIAQMVSAGAYVAFIPLGIPVALLFYFLTVFRVSMLTRAR